MHHPDKLPKQFRQIISHALSFQLRDPLLACVTVTHVKVSPDLQYSDVSVTLGGEEEKPVMAALERASGAIKKILAKSIKMRRVPILRFHLDTSSEDVARINDILSGLHIPPAEETEDDEF